MSHSQAILTSTFKFLISQEASAEIIYEVLMDEAELLFPSLDRQDLETIIRLVLEDARQERKGLPAQSNIVEFPVHKHQESGAH